MAFNMPAVAASIAVAFGLLLDFFAAFHTIFVRKIFEKVQHILHHNQQLLFVI